MKTAPLLEAAQNIIGGDWRTEDTGLQECFMDDGRVGDSWAALRLGPGLPKEGQTTALEKIRAAWSEAGYEPGIGTLPVINGVEVTQLRYPAAGRGPDGLYLEVQVATTGSTLESVASCIARAKQPDGEEGP
ncbi:hypothetical protein AX769_11295 [Frondihabitans sp. PAMC 28766]|nr:hypothetical protein AX769_11295 [Frondihabitans sp. PAMC 28766]